MELRDLVACKLCQALTTYEGRALHLGWHARINAKLFTVTEPSLEVAEEEPVVWWRCPEEGCDWRMNRQGSEDLVSGRSQRWANRLIASHYVDKHFALLPSPGAVVVGA